MFGCLIKSRLFAQLELETRVAAGWASSCAERLGETRSSASRRDGASRGRGRARGRVGRQQRRWRSGVRPLAGPPEAQDPHRMSPRQFQRQNRADRPAGPACGALIELTERPAIAPGTPRAHTAHNLHAVSAFWHCPHAGTDPAAFGRRLAEQPYAIRELTTGNQSGYLAIRTMSESFGELRPFEPGDISLGQLPPAS